MLLLISSLKISVIIPAFNEEQSIGKVVSDIPSFVDEVVVVNNNSTDSTVQVAEEAGATVLTENKKGYGCACLKGMDYLRSKNTDVVVFLDGDYSDYPEEMVGLIKPIEHDGYDMVIGSRVLGTRERGALTPQQVFGNWLATRLMKLFYGVSYSDLGPFRAIKWSSLEKLNMVDPTYGWTIEMQLKAAKLKMKTTEIAVNYRVRIGVSKVSGTIKGAVMAGIKIIWTIFKYL